MAARPAPDPAPPAAGDLRLVSRALLRVELLYAVGAAGLVATGIFFLGTGFLGWGGGSVRTPARDLLDVLLVATALVLGPAVVVRSLVLQRRRRAELVEALSERPWGLLVIERRLYRTRLTSLGSVVGLTLRFSDGNEFALPVRPRRAARLVEALRRLAPQAEVR